MRKSLFGIAGRFDVARLRFMRTAAVAFTIMCAAVLPGQGLAQTASAPLITPLKQAVAEAAAEDRALASVYRERDFAPIWTGAEPAHAERRAALIAALRLAPSHGLPAGRYDADTLVAELRAVRGAADLAAMEVRLSQAFLAYARDVKSGVLVPSSIDPGLVRVVARPDREALLRDFASAEPLAFLAALPPQSPEYTRLRKARMQLQEVIAAGGWGPTVPAAKYEPGDTGSGVIALRDRLRAKGYLPRGAQVTYDAALERAVAAFQADHGLTIDGITGQGTLGALNTSPEARLASVIVAMERERWLNEPRGSRHILVNLTDFSARIMDEDVETFRTRAVVGKNTKDRRTPEFSDVMDHMVINPSWHVPRSIATKEYLPELQGNPNAVSHLILTDSAGRVVDRSTTDFSAYTTRTFPYRMRQAPGRSNALGLVKFMFPNKYNIYLHDTPAKNLFGREVRAYSHGCVRLHQPFDFAYTLLEAQEADARGFFHRVLDTGRERRVDLVDPVPVHITYRTAFTDAKGHLQHRRDVYGRDAKIWEALSQAGVSLGAVQG